MTIAISDNCPTCGKPCVVTTVGTKEELSQESQIKFLCVDHGYWQQIVTLTEGGELVSTCGKGD